MIPALVLTAGLATRLQPLSLVRAKAALPVAGESLIRRILRYLAAAGVSDSVLNLYHLPHTLTAAVGDGSDLDIRVRYSWETPVLGSAGGPKRALPLLSSPSPLPPSPFLIVNGDTLTDVNLPALVDDHLQSDALVTLAVVPNVEPEKYGGILADGEGAFTGVVPRGSRQRSFHFIGVQVARPEAFGSVPDNAPYESLRRLYPDLIAAKRGSVRVFVSSAEFLDIGTPADYLETSLFIADREQHGASVGVAVHIDPSARVERSILWDDVSVGPGAVLKECVVTDGVRVPADTSWHGVTLRVAQGQITPRERVIDGLAVGPID
jgi:NDP-sugar pyrophosphorylase family protein